MVKVPVLFDILGPREDSGYWAECEAQIAALPAHVEVRTLGSLPHEQVVPTLAGYDLFFLPTMGENFGHAISEALSAGLPLLIADTTPWKAISSSGAGWDLPLAEPWRFVAAIEEFAAKRPDQRQEMRMAARALAEKSYILSDAIQANRTMFLFAMGLER